MSELLSAAQMRAIEKAAIESGEVTGLELMERAGRGVVEAIFEEWPELAEEGGSAPEPAALPRDISGKRKRRAVVLCGPGNNGGDGFVVARLLKERGWAVEVFLYGDPAKLPPDARVNYERWGEMGEVYDFLSPLETFPEHLWDISATDQGVIVDALFGLGLSRGLATDARMRLGEFRSRVPLSFLPVVSVDVPSGLCSDSGKYLVGEDGFSSEHFADLCVTFHRPKVGHICGELNCGRVITKPIGLDEIAHKRNLDDFSKSLGELADLLSATKGDVALFRKKVAEDATAFVDNGTEPPTVDRLVAVTDEVFKVSAHKYSHGHALILCGGAGKSGAARMAARGALRIGAGLVTLGVPQEACPEVAAQITAVMMREVEGAGALVKTLGDERLNALCLGPGLGVDRARELVSVALGGGQVESRPTVLDADALSVFVDAPEVLFDMLHGTCVLTPHEGEFKRLFPDIHAKLVAVPARGPAYSKVDATRDAARRAGCVVLFKGADTVIADPTGRCSINSAHYERSAPWLATAGSGDVLAGFVTGLLARGFDPMSAAETAAWLHVECALQFGPGLIAEDLPEQLPSVLRKLDI